MHLNRPGAPIVVPRYAYHTSLIVARDRSAHEGGQVREVDVADISAVAAAISADGKVASLTWIELPTNPILEVADIPTICGAVHATGMLMAVDNTSAILPGQCLPEVSTDVIVHSATKYPSGHSDVVLGVMLASRGNLHEALHEEYTDVGGVTSLVEAWLLLRSARILPLQMERIWASAVELVRRFEEYPLVAEIRHPPLPSHPQHERAKRSMSRFGGVLTMRPVGGSWAAEELGRFVRIRLPVVSLGGVESSFKRRRRFPTKAAAAPEDLLRVSVDIEDVEDLWRDLDVILKEVHQ